MGTEIELKLLVANRDLPHLREALKRHAGSRPHRRLLVSRYFDTPTLQFRDKGVALRVRKIAGRWVQTLKGGGGVRAGMHLRDEWETAVLGPAPDLARLAAAFPADAALQRMVKALSRKSGIVHVFTTEFRRDVFNIALPDGSHIEAAVDEGTVSCGRRSALISELELEMKFGDPIAAFDLARRLLVDVPLQIGVVSKSQRGYALLEKTGAGPPRRAAAVALRATMPVEDALAGVLAECLNHILENVDGVLACRDPEYLHQMRVALRRLRGALAVFGDVVPKVIFSATTDALRTLNQVLGEARNWDVLLNETLPVCATAMGAPACEPLMARLHRLARAANNRAARLVASRAFTDGVLRLAIFVLGRQWRAATGETVARGLAEPVGAFARRAISRRHRQLQKRAAAIEISEPETLHAVRIAAKKLRYTAEFFAPLFRVDAVRDYQRSLTALQDILGGVNDAAAGAGLLAGVAERAPALAPETAAIQAVLADLASRGQRRFRGAWRRFAKRPVLAD